MRRRQATIGPKVWELDGPKTILRMSNALIATVDVLGVSLDRCPRCSRTIPVHSGEVEGEMLLSEEHNLENPLSQP